MGKNMQQEEIKEKKGIEIVCGGGREREIRTKKRVRQRDLLQ